MDTRLLKCICGQNLLLPWIRFLIYFRNAWKACEKVKGLYQEKFKRLHQILSLLYEKYTIILAIELSRASRLHRENILITLITTTEYLPMSRS